MGIDVILLAGSKGSQFFKQDGREVPKTQYKIRHRTLAEWTLEGVLEADELINNVIVVGQEAITEDYGEKVIKVSAQDDPVRAVLYAYGTEILPANGFPAIPVEEFFDSNKMKDYKTEHPNASEIGAMLVMGDSPFITGKDIRLFLSALKKETDAALSFSTKTSLLEALSTIDEPRLRRKIKGKLKTSPISVGKIRFDGLFYLKPLKFGEDEYRLAQRLYPLRHQTNESGEWSESKFRKLLRVLAYHKSAERGKKFVRYILRLKAASKIPLLKKTKITPTDFEQAAHDYITYGIYQMIVMHGAAAMIDIDHKKVLRALEANDSKIFWQLKKDFSSDRYKPSLVYPEDVQQPKVLPSRPTQKASSYVQPSVAQNL